MCTRPDLITQPVLSLSDLSASDDQWVCVPVGPMLTGIRHARSVVRAAEWIAEHVPIDVP